VKLNPYLSFDGRCETALKFYAKVLGGKIQMAMTWGDSPMAKDMPPDWGKKIIHATFEVAGLIVGAADSPPGNYQKPQGFSMTLDFDAPAEAERIFKLLSEKGIVTMPIQPTFWAQRFAMFTDQFGTPWMINCGKKETKV
jgi:PhnB protein